jgi:hypothetical protein
MGKGTALVLCVLVCGCIDYEIPHYTVTCASNGTQTFHSDSVFHYEEPGVFFKTQNWKFYLSEKNVVRVSGDCVVTKRPM